ncbi:MAG: HIT family protein [Chloroherpetonaceae bacterium]
MDKMFSPWRSKYIASFKEPKPKNEKGSIFADLPPEEDEERLVVYRGKKCFVIMNLYPYNAGHLMVIPYQVTPNLSDLDDEAKLEAMNLIDLSMRALKMVCNPHGFNIGANIGAAAGGSVDSHLHFHIVPRWNGDTNFMPLIAETKVISNDMQELYHSLKRAFTELTTPS